MRLKDLRQQRKLKQTEIADVLNCSQGVYSRYESGEREPPFDIITRLADYYGVTVDYLMGREPQPEQEEPKITVHFRSDVQDLWNKLSPQNQALIMELGRKLFESQEKEKNK